MKNFSWKRKLAATLFSVGLLSPAAYAQCTINTDQVVNPGFENVDNSVSMGGYNAVQILDWSPTDVDGFAYSHDGSLNSMGMVIPDYANGGPLAGGESFYFTPAPSGVGAGNPIFQVIDVSTGPCGPLIAGGTASYKLSAFFSSYAGQGDFGTVQVEFLDSGGGVVGSASISDSDTTNWTQSATAGLLPSNTQSVRVSSYGTAMTGSADGYTDNIDFQVSDVLVLPALDIRLDRDTGSITLSNITGGPVNISGYSITSAIEALNPSNSTWLSIADNYDADGDRSVDPDHIWSELTNPATFTDLSEADLDSGLGATLAADQPVVLSVTDGWIKNPTEDLVFEYVSDGAVVTGIVNFVGNDEVPFDFGDFDTDSDIDQFDWMILRGNQHTDLSALRELAAYFRGDMNGDFLNNHTDFVLFADAFDQVNGEGSFNEMIANLPEPSGAILVLTGGLMMLGVGRRR